MTELTRGKSLRHLNTFGLDVSCSRFVEYSSVSDLIELFTQHCDSLLPPLLHIGGGSNLLFTADFPGTVLHSRISFINAAESDGASVTVEAGAGVTFDRLVEWTTDRQLWGLENLSLIPGETGAAAVQNIGAYGVEIADVIDRVTCFDTETLQTVVFKAADMRYGYRESRLKQSPDKGRYIVTSVSFRLSRKPTPRLGYGTLASTVADCIRHDVPTEPSPADVRDAVIRIRREKLPDPVETGSAGSFFKNPVVSGDIFHRINERWRQECGGGGDIPSYTLPDGDIKIPAAWLIDRCGFKGRSVGGAKVWEKQPLVIVNATGHVTASDILELERLIANGVRDRFGITLSPEVEHI